MNYQAHINSLTKKLKNINSLQVETKVKLADYCSFKVGGPADLFLTPKNIASLQKIMPVIYKSQLPYFILGKGSNLIISDKGYRGIIIYTGQLNKFQVKENLITAQTGIKLSKLADIACQNNLGGFEFAAGIPGTLGGALYMNAGAYGGEIKDIIKKASLINKKGKIETLTKKDLELSYRNSLLQKQSQKLIAVSLEIELEITAQEQITAKMEELHQKRWTKQPMELPSAGSIFKRPPNNYTGPLIEQAELKGHQIGGAQVSTKHAGFIVNKGNATAADIVNLINKVKKEVYKISGIQLKVEPRFLGEF